jgi:hypothetical protein
MLYLGMVYVVWVTERKQLCVSVKFAVSLFAPKSAVHTVYFTTAAIGTGQELGVFSLLLPSISRLYRHM